MGSKIPQRYIFFSYGSTHLPFLYLTRSLTTSFLSPPDFFSTSQLSSAPRCSYSTHPSPPDGKPPQNPPLTGEDSGKPDNDVRPRPSRYLKSYRSQEAESSKQDDDQIPSTITPAERSVFMRLFRNMGLDSASAPPKLKSAIPPTERQKVKRRKGAKPSTTNDKPVAETQKADRPVAQTKTQSEISDIFSSSVKKLRDDEDQRSLEPNRAEADAQSKIEPTGLRKLHAKLRHFEESKADTAAGEDEMAAFGPFPFADQVAEREANKICKEMDDAVTAGKGDIGIWKICENRVFAMVKLVDAEEAKTSPWVPIPADDSAKTSAEDSPLDLPPNVPVLAVVSKAYPKTLIHALGLLHTHFPLSPFSTQLPDAVKSHSRLSSILGASTKFYNDLIAFRWNIYHDLPQIISLIKDMEVTGVHFDRETLETVDKIRRNVQEAKREKAAEKSQSDGGSQSWATDATRDAFKELVGKKYKTGWLTKMRTQVKRDELMAYRLRDSRRKHSAFGNRYS